VPGQFVAKQYVEALGRLPDPSGWQDKTGIIAAQGCTAAVLADVSRGVYTSPEFLAKPYDTSTRLLALYRGALNREPDAVGLAGYRNQIDSGSMTFPAVVDDILASSEFAAYAGRACNPADGSQYFGDDPAIDLPVSGPGFSGSQAQLQALLDATPAGGSVALASRAVIRITQPLDIPDGVTLTTVGAPTPDTYALMGRLVRQGNFGAPLVRIAPRGFVSHVWIDGSRGNPGDFDFFSTNVELLGGDGNGVTYSRMGNTAGWTNLQAIGTFEFVSQGKGAPCPGTTLSHNLIDAFSSSNNDGRWSDGLSVACENATIEYNQIIDATDVGIVIFRASPATQSSRVRFNTVANTGNPTFAGIVADPLSGFDAAPGFAGSVVEQNTLWTASSSRMRIGLSLGTRPWFTPGGPIGENIGRGATFTGNTTGGFTMNATLGISVSGMLDATVTGNDLDVVLAQYGNCPQARVGASVSAGLASGTIQQPFTDVLIQSCL
jgi:hypothetical protein